MSFANQIEPCPYCQGECSVRYGPNTAFESYVACDDYRRCGYRGPKSDTAALEADESNWVKSDRWWRDQAHDSAVRQHNAVARRARDFAALIGGAV